VPCPAMIKGDMPFTPFHLGPGALFKAIGGDRFSFIIFGGSQILMDLEPLVRIIRGDAVLHGISHTVLGAFVIALASAAAGRPIGNAVLRHSSTEARPIGWAVATASAFIGTYSHIALDAVMHRDMNPFWPIAYGNNLLGLIPLGRLHVLCVMSGVLGASLILWRTKRRSGGSL